MDKQSIRKEVTEKKRRMSEAEISRLSLDLKEKFCSLEEYGSASVLYAYMSYNQEVRTAPIIEQAWEDGKRVAVPRIFNKEYMEFIYINSFDELESGYMGIPEPKYEVFADDFDRIAQEQEVLMLLPGLAFDKEGSRLGYGGGFYDMYLEDYSEETNFIKTALCYDFQIYEKLKTEDHDVKIDIVISNSRMIRTLNL